MTLVLAATARASMVASRTRLTAGGRALRDGLAGHRAGFGFVLSVVAVNVTSLVGTAFAFRWIDPTSMGVWHTLLLASSYATVVRLGLVNGMGRELPFALGQGDTQRARRIAATSLAYTVVTSAVVGAAFIAAAMAVERPEAAWRVALPAMAAVSASNLYLAYLLATFRSESDFARLTWIHSLQAALGLLLPFMVRAFGFDGLCLHAVLQSVLVTVVAHAARPLRVAFRFEPRLAGQLLATGMPLFVAAYLQTVAAGFDRVILLHRGSIESVGYYAPAAAVVAAMAIVPGAVSTYIYPRMSFALGEGCREVVLRRMAIRAALVSVAAGFPLVVAGWVVAPPVIGRFFAQYLPSVPAVRWSLVSGLLWSLSPAAQVLGSVKAWRSLGVYIAVILVARWAFPWFLSHSFEPLEGVARGNALAAAVAGAVSLVLVWRVGRTAPEAVAP